MAHYVLLQIVFYDMSLGTEVKLGLLGKVPGYTYNAKGLKGVRTAQKEEPGDGSGSLCLPHKYEEPSFSPQNLRSRVHV